MSTYKQWGYQEGVTSADLNALARNAIPRFDTLAELQDITPEHGQMAWVRDVPIYSGQTTYRASFFQGRPNNSGGQTWVAYGTPGVRLRQTTAQTIGTGAYTKMLWHTTEFDANLTLSSSIWTCPGTGLYEMYCKITWNNASATGYRGVQFSSGGSVLPGGFFASYSSGGAPHTGQGTWSGYLTAGTQVLINAYQNSGGNLDTYVTLGLDSMWTIKAV